MDSHHYGGTWEWALCSLVALALVPLPRRAASNASAVADSLLTFLENGTVLAVLAILATALMIIYSWVLAVLGILLLRGLYKSNVIPLPWKWPWKAVVYIVALIAIGFALTSFRKVVIREVMPHPYLHVDKVEVAIGRLGPAPVTVQAHIYGHNVLPTASTSPNPAVFAAIVVRPYIEPDHASEENALFVSGKWGGSGYLGFNHSLNPLQTFEFSKEESLVVLDAMPFSFETAKRIQNGTLVIYVLTKAEYMDRWGSLPEVRSCTVFSSARDHSLDNLIQGPCWGVYQQ